MTTEHGFTELRIDNGAETFFPAEGGGRLVLGRGELRCAVRFGFAFDDPDPEGTDVIACEHRLADDRGEVWQAQGLFSASTIIGHMGDLRRTSWLHYYEQTDPGWRAALEQNLLLSGARAFYDDRFYRRLLIGSSPEPVEVQFRYLSVAYDLALFRHPMAHALLSPEIAPTFVKCL